MRPRTLLAVALCVAAVAALAVWVVVRISGQDTRSDRCGPVLTKPGGGTWECTLAEDFTGSALNGDVWEPHTMAGTDNMCVLDSPRTVEVADGHLRLTVRAADTTTVCPARADGTRAAYAAGWVSSHHRWSQQYGRFEARIRVQSASVRGLHEAFWLWPDVRHGADEPWPASGEIDIMETYSERPGLVVPFLHYGEDDGPVDGVNTAWSCPTSRGEWHTYALEWSADELRILVDGETCLVNTEGAASFRKRFIINFTQFLGSGNNLYDGKTPLPATMEVDHVRVWR